MAKQDYKGRAVEEEGIVTSRLPAYTDILKIRFERICKLYCRCQGNLSHHFLQENVRLQNTKGTRLQLSTRVSRVETHGRVLMCSRAQVWYKIGFHAQQCHSCQIQFRTRMAFGGAQKNCPRATKGARMYEPRDYAVVLHVTFDLTKCSG